MFAQIEKWKDNISYQTGLLAVTCGIAAILLVSTEIYTRPMIEQRISEDQNALLKEVLDGQPYSNDVFSDGHNYVFDGKTYEIYDVKDADGNVTCHVIRGVQEGYSGPIRYLVGVDLNGVIKGVRIISHTETPGLGDKIELAKSDWVLEFNHRSLANTPLWAVKKDGGDFDQFSGATITPRSVVNGIHNAMLALQQDKEQSHE